MLHLEIITERLRREASLELIITAPTTDYIVYTKNGERIEVSNPSQFPDHGVIAKVEEPYVHLRIIAPPLYISVISQIVNDFEGRVLTIEEFQNDRSVVDVEMPLREFMRKFFDRLKSATSGYGSVSYERIGYREGDVSSYGYLACRRIIPSIYLNRVSCERATRRSQISRSNLQ